MIQTLKNWLVSLGPDHPLVQAALKLHGRRSGFSIHFSDTIILDKRDSRMILKKPHFMYVPFMLEIFDQYFTDFRPDSVLNEMRGSIAVLDFSKAGLHTFNNGNAYHFPAIPEEESITAYTYWHTPKPGDIVWDVGAHAGVSTVSVQGNPSMRKRFLVM